MATFYTTFATWYRHLANTINTYTSLRISWYYILVFLITIILCLINTKLLYYALINSSSKVNVQQNLMYITTWYTTTGLIGDYHIWGYRRLHTSSVDMITSPFAWSLDIWEAARTHYQSVEWRLLPTYMHEVDTCCLPCWQQDSCIHRYAAMLHQMLDKWHDRIWTSHFITQQSFSIQVYNWTSHNYVCVRKPMSICCACWKFLLQSLLIHGLKYVVTCLLSQICLRFISFSWFAILCLITFLCKFYYIELDWLCML